MGTVVILTLFATLVGGVVVLFLSGRESAAGKSPPSLERGASDRTGSGDIIFAATADRGAPEPCLR